MRMSDDDRKDFFNIIIGVTGSVATIKLDELIERIREKFNNEKVNICVIPTQNSLHFLPEFNEKFQNDMKSLQERLEFIRSRNNERQGRLISFVDQDEWSAWSQRSDPVLHIDLRKWCDLLLIAPLDANTLAKISNGLCDNLLTSLIRAWDVKKSDDETRKRVVVCPAMNTYMYEHPITQKQLLILENEFKFDIIQPIEKILICGDRGIGAMAHLQTIVDHMHKILNSK